MTHTLTDIILWFLGRNNRSADARFARRLFGQHDLDHLVELRILRKTVDHSRAMTYYALCGFTGAR